MIRPGTILRNCFTFNVLMIIALVFPFPGTQAQGFQHHFGYKEGFCLAYEKPDYCITYFDSVSYSLYNPCLDAAVRGIYSSCFARKLFLGDRMACDTSLMVRRGSMNHSYFMQTKKLQQDIYDVYYQSWLKQQKKDQYQVDLEGAVRGFLSHPPF